MHSLTQLWSGPEGGGTSGLAAMTACCCSLSRPAKMRGPMASRKAPRHAPAAALHSWFSQVRLRNRGSRNSSMYGLNTCAAAVANDFSQMRSQQYRTHAAELQFRQTCLIWATWQRLHRFGSKQPGVWFPTL